MGQQGGNNLLIPFCSLVLITKQPQLVGSNRTNTPFWGKAMHSMAALLSPSMACMLQDHGAGCKGRL